jgi:adenine C2-methylase RlmN of 23S rRNA A2503 and tRNA A37
MKELNIGSRHITISTVGVVPRILQLADEQLQVCRAYVRIHVT